jgi:hypothetical protein
MLKEPIAQISKGAESWRIIAKEAAPGNGRKPLADEFRHIIPSSS